MSRRNDRDSDAKRHRSRFDSEPSPKRSRRDGKPAQERVLNSNYLDARDRGDGDRKPRQRLQDAAPLEASSAPGSRFENQAVSKESVRKYDGRYDEFNKKRSGNREGPKDLADPTETPRSRSFFQHDDRGNAGNMGRRAAERGWWRDGRVQHTGRVAEAEKSRHVSDDKGVWRHDKFRETEDDPAPPPMRKRPAFREKKLPSDSENTEKTGINPARGHRASQSERGDQEWNPRDTERHERPYFRDRFASRGEKDGNVRGGSRGFRGGERFNRGREGFRGGGGGSGSGGGGGSGSGGGMKNEKKWEHDLFNEANKTPPRKNEEEQIAKLEALLAS